jgi:hypothetical protein
VFEMTPRMLRATGHRRPPYAYAATQPTTAAWSVPLGNVAPAEETECPRAPTRARAESPPWCLSVVSLRGVAQSRRRRVALDALLVSAA